MRLLLLCLIGLTAVATDAAFAQMKLPSKAAPGASETRYFTALDGLMNGNADVVLKETRQGKTVTAVKLDAAIDFVKGLKGQDLEVSLSSLSVSCDELRSGVQTINLTVDPDRAGALIAKAKSTPGVVEAGWSSGAVEMDRAIRFAAADWRDGDKINRDKLATAISGVLSKTLAAKPSSSAWNANTGKLKLTFKRPSPVLPALALTETIEITALVSSDKPGASDRLLLWVSSPVITTA